MFSTRILQDKQEDKKEGGTPKEDIKDDDKSPIDAIALKTFYDA